MPMVFPTSPVVGQVFSSGGRSWVWTGSTWDSPSATNVLQVPIGLVHLNTTPFTASTLVRVNSVFSSAYDNYLIKIDYKSSQTVQQVLQLRYLTAVDAPTSTSLYNRIGFLTSTGSGLTNYSGSNEGNILVGVSDQVNGGSSELQINNPFLSARTSALVQILAFDQSVLYSPNNVYQADTIFNGFQLTPNVGTVTGTVRTYGYRNA